LEVAKSAYTLSRIAARASTKNRLRAAFPFAQRQKGLNTILVNFVHARKNYPPSCLAYHLLQDGEENRKVITMPLSRAARRAPRAKNAHQGVVYARRRRSAQPIANKTQARNATCV
jgi:hypothetical protein